MSRLFILKFSFNFLMEVQALIVFGWKLEKLLERGMKIEMRVQVQTLFSEVWILSWGPDIFWNIPTFSEEDN